MIKIKIRTLFLCLIGFVGIKLLVEFKYDKRPFKFESYKIYEDFQRAVDDKFKVGSDIDYALNILQDSGAKCRINNIVNPSEYPNDFILSDAIFIINCNYTSSFTILYEYACYYVSIQIDKNLKIVHTHGHRTKYCGMWMI